MAFTPDTPEQRELLPELRGQQLIRRYTEAYWGLTERGLAGLGFLIGTARLKPLRTAVA